MPPIWKATTGVPQAKDSTTVFGKLSCCEGVTKTSATREKMSIARKGLAKSEEHKLKLQQAILAVPKIKCECCHNFISPGNYKRWHGDKCKQKELSYD